MLFRSHGERQEAEAFDEHVDWASDGAPKIGPAVKNLRVTALRMIEMISRQHSMAPRGEALLPNLIVFPTPTVPPINVQPYGKKST